MPAAAAKGQAGKNAAGDTTKKKTKEPPKELCGCGVDTYRPPPKGKKLTTAPVEHLPGCNYQRTTCDAYPHLPRCEVCQHPCSFCGGKNRWCPHCYETQCAHRYKRVVHGWEPPSIDAGPGDAAAAAAGVAAMAGRSASGGANSAKGTRLSTVKFSGSGSGAMAASSSAKSKSRVSFAASVS